MRSDMPFGYPQHPGGLGYSPSANKNFTQNLNPFQIAFAHSYQIYP
jgi:hypothetical protein